MAGETWVATHPALADKRNYRTVIPIVVYGDDAQHIRNDKLKILQWSSVVSRASTLDSKLIFAVLPVTACVIDRKVHSTVNKLQAVLRWSLVARMDGRWPSVDHDGKHFTDWRANKAGQPLAGPFRCAFAGNKGDMQWHVMWNRFSRYWQCNYICHRCLASKANPELAFTDVSDSATWLATEISCRQHLREYGANPPPIVQVPGWDPKNCYFDIMHCLYLGLGQDLSGSLISDLAFEGLWLGSGTRHLPQDGLLAFQDLVHVQPPRRLLRALHQNCFSFDCGVERLSVV